MSSTHYTEEHEWIKADGNKAIVGITNHAQEQLGDIVFVELPDVGTTMAKGDDTVVVESVKAASDVYAPAGGEVTKINEALDGEPSIVNASAEGDGWLYEMTLSDTSELDAMMSAEEYAKFVESES